jgi:hypothetical protein
MHALKTAWTTVARKGTVVGLAPSAVAARVLAEELGIGCENTAKCLYDHDHEYDYNHDGRRVGRRTRLQGDSW